VKQLVVRLAAFAVIVILCGGGCQSGKNPADRKPWSLSNLTARDETKPASMTGDKFDVYGEANPDRLLLQDLGPGRIRTTLATRFGGGQNQKVAESKLREGEALYDKAIRIRESERDSAEATRLFRQAAAKFEIAGDKMRDSALEQDALFMQGEAYFFANDYVLANRAYEILLNRYSGTSQLDLVEARRFEIAQYWLAINRQGAGIAVGDASRPMTGLEKEARRILHRIRLDDPTGKLADDATLALGNAFMEAEQFSDAADTYEDLRRTYPGSPHQFLAHKFEIQARLAAYRGANYDGTDVVKSEQVLKSMLKLFPEESRKDQELLAEQGTRIRHLLAERDWTIARYYEGRGENRAALHYYSTVARDYDDTEFASEAGERIAALGGLPPVPEQKAQWLADLFPVKERNKPLIATGDRESVLR
jgi:outer membrane protein assembly factor BamD (BamD/ComL family)